MRLSVNPGLELEQATASLGLDIDGNAAEKLLEFASDLGSRGVELGLIAPSDAPRVLGRHVVDSLRAVLAIAPADRTALDLGSGGGLPGIPVAIAAPGLRVTLVEARRKRAAWLEMIVEVLGLTNVSVAHARIEEVRSDPVDVCFARALGPVGRCWALAREHLTPQGRLVYFAGAGFDEHASPPPGTKVRLMERSSLESGGTLVIIGRE